MHPRFATDATGRDKDWAIPEGSIAYCFVFVIFIPVMTNCTLRLLFSCYLQGLDSPADLYCHGTGSHLRKPSSQTYLIFPMKVCVKSPGQWCKISGTFLVMTVKIL